MLMMGNKEKAVGIILKGMGGKDAAASAPQPAQTENDYDEGKKMAAQDVLNAIEEKNPERLARALKAVFQMCQMEPEDD
jgi:hypothetical protein